MAWSVVTGGPTRIMTQEKGRPPRFLGNPCTRVPRSSTPMGVARPCPKRTNHCGLPTNLRRRPPPHAPLRGSITRPTCVLSTLHDEGHPIAMQDSLPACWLGVDWAGLAPAGFQSRISRDRLRPPFPSSQASLAHKFCTLGRAPLHQGHLVFHVNPDERQCLCRLGRQLTARCCNIRIASPPEQANRGVA